jgi:protein phosphatase 1 regulatory subunit 7
VACQEITRIENLNLPFLRELYLHRNLISSMDGLQSCPRLKKLWLCQNQISTISNLSCLPELEELWLQTNLISSLHGLESCHRLTHLNVAGNIISDFSELRRLSSLHSLTKLSFQDIHFGRCPVTDSEGYKEFILCHLKQVWLLSPSLLSESMSS